MNILKSWPKRLSVYLAEQGLSSKKFQYKCEHSGCEETAEYAINHPEGVDFLCKRHATFSLMGLDMSIDRKRTLKEKPNE